MKRVTTIIKDLNKMGFGFAVCESRSLAENVVIVSAEDWTTEEEADRTGIFQAADYYGEFRGGYPWIHPDLEDYAEKNGMYWEWENAGSIQLYKV